MLKVMMCLNGASTPYIVSEDLVTITVPDITQFLYMEYYRLNIPTLGGGGGGEVYF